MPVETEQLQHRPKEDKLQMQHRDAEGGGEKEQVPAHHLQQVPGVGTSEGKREHLSDGKLRTKQQLTNCGRV